MDPLYQSFETCGVTITLYGSVEVTVLGYLCLLSKQEAGLRLQLTHSYILPILWGHSALILSGTSFIVFNSLQRFMLNISFVLKNC